ncbi:MAG: sensor domain-containing diguanylate cyclase [Xanthomonadales bacterium]|nr:sensor domain-containing diguanylate cyclase [Xanthomonadales bacterium]
MTGWLLQGSVGALIGLLLGLGLVAGFGRSWPAGRAERERRSREAILHALARAARILFSAQGNDRVMPTALAVLGKAVSADRVYVFENHRDANSGELLGSMRYEWTRPGIRAEIDNPDMQGMSYDRDLPNWRVLFEAREPVVGLAADMDAVERELIEAQQILSILVVPIFLEGKFWGLIGFDDCTTERQWGQAEIDALEVASGTIGGAIRSMRAEEELRRLVSTDSLTGLSSRRAFLEQAEDLLERARDSERALSLLILDLDHFKSINDRFGHPVGDEALVAFARVCRQVLRDEDLIGRTGGEEFAVVLQGADADKAGKLAERLRRAIDETVVSSAAGEFSLSVSIGAAPLSAGEVDLNRWLKQADDALYAAKRNGRNRIEIATH